MLQGLESAWANHLLIRGIGSGQAVQHAPRLDPRQGILWLLLVTQATQARLL
jgi:hypothetical protein